MSGRDPTFAEFEPAPLRPRSRRVDPVLVGALVVVVAVATAVIKPWAGDETAATSPAPSSADAAIAPPATGRPHASAAASSAPVRLPSTPPISWARAATAVRPHEAWGIRALVRDPEPYASRAVSDPPSGLVERWTEADPTPDGDAHAVMSTADLAVVALGVTHPPDDLPLDVRISRRAGDTWRWLDVPAIGTSPAFGAWLFGPPRVADIGLPRWLPGAYRVDILTASGIRRIDTFLPSRWDSLPEGVEDEGWTADGTLQSPFAPAFGDLRATGPFLVTHGVVQPIGAFPQAPADAERLWRYGVPSVYNRRGNGLGILLPAGASHANATLHAVAPEEGPVDARRVIGLRFAGDERLPFVIFRAPGGQPWSPGVYRLDATWTEGDEARAASWHVALQPGPLPLDGELLATARVLSVLELSDGAWSVRADTIEAQDLACAADDGAPDSTGATAIGITHPSGPAPSSVRADQLFDGGRTVTVPLLLARGALPGVSLIVPAGADAFAPGVYRLRLETDDGDRSMTICVGTVLDR